MVKNKKIILHTPRLFNGGVLEYNKIIARSLINKGFNVIIVSNRETNFKIDNLKHIYLNAGDFFRPYKLKYIIEREKPLAVFSNMLPQNISLSLAKYLTKDKRVKYSGIVHNTTSYEEYKNFYKFPYRIFVKKLYKNLDKIIAVSNIAKIDLERAFFLSDNDIEVIHNPINIDKINYLKNETLSDNEKNILKNSIIFVGRFAKPKRLDLLLKVFSKVLDIDKNINLVLVGDGEEKKNVIKLAENLNIKDKVFIFPYTSNPFKYMKNAYLFALTSQDEGFGRVVAESLACGIPVVAFENEKSGHKDIIQNGKNGFLVPFGKEETMAKTIIDLFNDKNLYNRLKENTVVSVEKFSVDKIVDKIIELIYAKNNQ